MAERPEVLSKRVTRADLAEFLPNSRAIRAFENMVQDLTQTLPDAIENSSADADSLLAVATFVAPPSLPPTFHNAASDMLAGQIFGA